MPSADFHLLLDDRFWRALTWFAARPSISDFALSIESRSRRTESFRKLEAFEKSEMDPTP